MKSVENKQTDGREIEDLFRPGSPGPFRMESYLADLATRLDIGLLALLEVAPGGKSAGVKAAGHRGVTCELTVPRLEPEGCVGGLVAGGEVKTGRAKVFSREEIFPAGGPWCDLIPMDSSVSYAFVPLGSLPFPGAAEGGGSRPVHFLLGVEEAETESGVTFPVRVVMAAALVALVLSRMEGQQDRKALRVLTDILMNEGYSIGFFDNKGNLGYRSGGGFDRLPVDVLKPLLSPPDPADPRGRSMVPAKSGGLEGAGDIAILAHPLETPGGARRLLVALKERTAESGVETRAERLRLMSRLMSTIAHEIKNPLTGIAAGIQYLARKMQPGLQEDETVQFILNEVNRLNRIVDDLYKIAKPPELVLGEVDLEDVLGRSLICLSEDVTRKRIVVEQRIDSDLPVIEADPDRLQQVWINIIKNAIEASPEGGVLALEITRSDSRVFLRISDGGPGIPDEDREKIFEPFFSTKERGSGLGLCISQRIIDEHGGTIRIETPDGGGTSFVIELPIRR
jgi:two-component sensor histidine kinase